MPLAPKTTPRRQPRKISKLKPKWAVIEPRFKELYRGKPLKECIDIIQKESSFRATLNQYVRYARSLGIYKYAPRRNSPHRAVERSAQNALQTQLAPNSNHAAYPIEYATSTSEAQNEPHWSHVGNGALLMEEDMYPTAGTHAHTQSGPNVSLFESMIPFEPHITSAVPFAVGPSSIDIHSPLEVSRGPYAHSWDDFHDGNTANNTWHPRQGFGTYDQSPLLGSGYYDNDEMNIGAAEVPVNVLAWLHQP